MKQEQRGPHEPKPAPSRESGASAKLLLVRPVVEAIVWALVAGVATGLGVLITDEMWMGLFGFAVFVIAFVVRVNPQLKRIAAELDEKERAEAYHYDEDESFEQFLRNFDLTGNWENFSFALDQWQRGDWADDTRARLLQQAVLICADRGMGDRMETLMAELAPVAKRLGAADRLGDFRAMAQARLANAAGAADAAGPVGAASAEAQSRHAEAPQETETQQR